MLLFRILFALFAVLALGVGPQSCLALGSHVKAGTECGSAHGSAADHDADSHDADSRCGACNLDSPQLAAPVAALPRPTATILVQEILQSLEEALSTPQGASGRVHPPPDPVLAHQALAVSARTLPVRGPNAGI